ncbi:hypothetical protein [Streptomyces sp. NPDC001828]|uniref:hypothetical protein n=1 Tax=Streptomyces sp. NPDC001828 TaxID=3364615 RepID=UPI0036BC8664
MDREFSIRDTEFTRWLLDHARTAGWDLDADTDGRDKLRMAAALIRTSGIGAVDTPRLARLLGVTVADIVEAARTELETSTAMQTIMDQPDVAALDEKLDGIAHDD